jgi:ectoine hydroxylase-related dioxygenase (phytanoyl-CoA dioxygenase family)
MLLFESWLQHTVEQNKSDHNRISVSFNIWADKDA